MKQRNKSIVWSPNPDPVGNGDRITCRIDETIVSGIIGVSPKVLKVLMDFPRTGSMRVMCIDPGEPLIFTERALVSEPLNEYGFQEAKSLLLEQYFEEFA